MTASTPIARSKSAALSRVLDLIPKGYAFYTAGECPAGKLQKLLGKFHEKYAIGCSPAQRITRKRHGLANALLVLYWPGMESGLASDSASPQASPQMAGEMPGSELVSWLLLVTKGRGRPRAGKPGARSRL